MSENTHIQPENWVSNYADYLYSFALRRINDPELCKDLIQETFIAALKSQNGFKGRSSERTWLTSILKNKIVDVYRSKVSRESPDLNSGDQALEGLFDNNGHWKANHFPQQWDMNDSFESKEFATMLRSCMGRLPSIWSVVFKLKYMDDERTDKICRDLNLTSSNYWVILHRAKVMLRACVEKNWINI
jgi:RNA polymerase sigma-70 factor (ECF subfamily)